MQTEEKSEALTVGARKVRWATRARPSEPRQLLQRRRGPKGASPKTLPKDRLLVAVGWDGGPFAHYEGLRDSPLYECPAVLLSHSGISNIAR